MSEKKTTKAKDRIDARLIVENQNNRNPLPPEVQQKWGWFTGAPNDLRLKAVSADAAERAEYVKAFEGQEDFLAYAATFLSTEQIYPIEVAQKAGKTEAYALWDGARRLSAILYNWCVQGGKGTPWIKVKLVKGNSTSLFHRGMVANMHKAPSPMENARALKHLFNQNWTIEEIAREQGRSTTWVENQLDLLVLPIELQRQVESGKVKPTKALAMHKEAEGHEAKPRTGVKKLLKSALEPLVQECKEAVWSDLLEQADADQEQKVTVQLALKELKALLALTQPKTKK